MRNVSSAYRQAVYQKGAYAMFARHFLPSALFKIIDVDARGTNEYAASSAAFFTDYAGLSNDVLLYKNTWGTLEDFQFNLNGENCVLMGDDNFVKQALIYGWCAEELSDADGLCDITLQCTYQQSVTTIGRTLFFDNMDNGVPADFDICYYQKGVLIHTTEIRNNTSVIVTSKEGCSNFDRVIFHFYRTSVPYHRIRIIEDIPGIYLEYSGDDITSLVVNKSVDIFMADFVTGEMDLSVQNVTKQLDILNAAGFEKYLMRRQPLEVYLNLVFPNDTVEKVLVGSWRLATWKSDKGALEATFTIQDPSMQLNSHDYIKGTMPTSYASLYDYAVAVLEDAGIEDYEIDRALLNKYTKAPLPIGTHKELLRLIAQAGQCVILPRDNGSLTIKSISPLVYGQNKLTNSSFEAISGWMVSGAALSQEYIFFGTNSIKFGTGSCYAYQSVSTVADRKYYVSVRVLTTQYLETLGSAYLNVDGVNVSPNIADANVQVEQWTQFSAVVTASSLTTVFRVDTNLSQECFYIDGVMFLDLTLLYGAGHEPTAEWCDENIRFFVSTMNIPRYEDPTPVDELDYSILIDAPEVHLDDPIDAVLTKIYSYSIDAETSEVYKASRVVNGTEEFEIRFNYLVKDPTIVIETLNEAGEVIVDITSTALVSIEWYAKAALLKVCTNNIIQIRVNGYKINENSTDYVVNSKVDPRLTADAESKTIDNKLITYNVMAEDVTSFAVYWYSRRYIYDFDWRQNPAIELLDTVTVHDDFNNDNGVLLTDLDISYQNGILSGSAKGRY